MNSDTRVYPFAIVAGGMQRLPISGDKFIIESTTGPVDVSWQGGKLLSRLAGQGYNVEGGFAQLVLNNSGAGDIVGTIQIADENAIDNRIAGSVSVSAGATFAPTAPAVGIASGVLLAANASRAYLLIQNNHATGNIWLGFGVAAVVGVGVKISAGGSYEPAGKVPINAINVVGDVINALVAVIEG